MELNKLECGPPLSPSPDKNAFNSIHNLDRKYGVIL